MPKKILVTDNWILPDREGTLHRFSTYSVAAKAKRERPTEFARDADIKFARPGD